MEITVVNVAGRQANVQAYTLPGNHYLNLLEKRLGEAGRLGSIRFNRSQVALD